jgi:membrane protein YqaA with SNARE-associated domain
MIKDRHSRIDEFFATHIPEWVSFGWGFAEATIFFIVPDVWIGWAALMQGRKSMAAIFAAIAGAMLGGMAMYCFGLWRGTDAEALLTCIPLIHSTTLHLVWSQLQTTGLPAILTGPFLGIPYKVYAVEAGRLGLPLAPFLLLTVPARGARFLFVALLGIGFQFIFPRLVRERPRIIAGLYGAVWALFYAAYYLLMRSA